MSPLRLLLVASVFAASCASDGAASSEVAAAPESVASHAYGLQAGEQSQALGITRWEVVGNSFRAVDAASQRVAEIHLDEQEMKVESIFPEAGVQSIRDKSLNTFSPRSTQYLDALKSDLKTAAAAHEANIAPADQEAIDKGQWIFVDCYIDKVNCIAVGQDLLFGGRINHYDCTDIYPANCTHQYPIQLSVELLD